MKSLVEEKGFTLIEMMIVLLIISVLILIAIPNVTKHSKSIDEKGCAAYVNTIRGISSLVRNPIVPRVWRLSVKWSIDLTINMAHFKHKKIEVTSIFFELVARRKSLITRIRHGDKTLHNFLMYPIVSNIGGIFKEKEKGFFRMHAVETLLFAVINVYDEQPLSIAKKHVRESLPPHKLGYITQSYFLFYSVMKGEHSQYKGAVGLSAS